MFSPCFPVVAVLCVVVRRTTCSRTLTFPYRPLRFTPHSTHRVPSTGPLSLHSRCEVPDGFAFHRGPPFSNLLWGQYVFLPLPHCFAPHCTSLPTAPPPFLGHPPLLLIFIPWSLPLSLAIAVHLLQQAQLPSNWPTPPGGRRPFPKWPVSCPVCTFCLFFMVDIIVLSYFSSF